ncbi:MAG: Asp-tRNA(Asn)/Glu-tRNA(Gln) amidotransferase subunit GatA [Spirochaetales bacterium]
MDYTKLSILEVSALLQSGKVTSEELVEQSFKNIEKNKDLNALNSTYYEEAIKEAKRIDALRKSGESLPLLAGIPVVLKDNISVKGYKNTCSSKFLKDYVAVYDATVTTRLKENGAIIIAKANMDEFAMGSSNENSAFGPVLNPVNRAYVSGGSSGGSTVSVASYEAYGALGTDTGGSVRQPASFCGVVGLKPTYGLVSRYGVVAFGSSFDQVGTLTRTVKDGAIMLNALAGHDINESTSANRPKVDYLKEIKGDIKGLRIGIAKEFFGLGMDEDVKLQIEKAIEFYKSHGAQIVDIELKNIGASLPVYYVLSSAEASSNLGRFDGVRYGTRSEKVSNLHELYLNSRTEGFGKEVKRRIMLGNFVLSSGYYDAYYKKAEKVRELLKEEFNDAFEKCDVILTPTSPSVAFKLGEKSNDHIKMYLSDIYTVVVNTIGVPAISVPCGNNENGLPIGMQLIAKHFDEGKLFNAADYFEKHFNGEGK